jgi:trk system potassium uptake protein TrkH
MPHKASSNKTGKKEARGFLCCFFLRRSLSWQQHTLKCIRIIVSKKMVREILLVIGLYIFISLVTGAVLDYLTNSTYEDALFESVSALTTTGLTAGITSIDLDLFSKLMLTANMIVGRFEIITVLYIFFYSLRK